LLLSRVVIGREVCSTVAGLSLNNGEFMEISK
jgi:hypothetical protein